jgi:hypothetical protein
VMMEVANLARSVNHPAIPSHLLLHLSPISLPGSPSIPSHPIPSLPSHPPPILSSSLHAPFQPLSPPPGPFDVMHFISVRLRASSLTSCTYSTVA